MSRSTYRMPNLKFPNLNDLVGTPVITLKDSGSKDWDKSTRDNVMWGAAGHIVRTHNAHGTVFEVQHFDGTVAPYEPAELWVVPVSRPSVPVNPPAQDEGRRIHRPDMKPSDFIPGSYRHYKGNLYTALFLARNSEELEQYRVIYVGVDGSGCIWDRPWYAPGEDSWTDFIAVGPNLVEVPRFKLVGSAT